MMTDHIAHPQQPYLFTIFDFNFNGRLNIKNKKITCGRIAPIFGVRII
jgi:hypothetical protein